IDTATKSAGDVVRERAATDRQAAVTLVVDSAAIEARKVVGENAATDTRVVGELTVQYCAAIESGIAGKRTVRYRQRIQVENATALRIAHFAVCDRKTGKCQGTPRGYAKHAIGVVSTDRELISAGPFNIQEIGNP